jgi:uncharacterized membrane protein
MRRTKNVVERDYISMIIAILYAIKAGRGKWEDYPVIGKLARKILKMDPVEGSLAPMPQM